MRHARILQGKKGSSNSTEHQYEIPQETNRLALEKRAQAKRGRPARARANENRSRLKGIAAKNVLSLDGKKNVRGIKAAKG